MLKDFWRKNKKFILVALLVYLIVTLIIIFGGSTPELPFNYQIR